MHNHTLRFDETETQPFLEAKQVIELAELYAKDQFTRRQSEPLVHPVNGDAQRKLLDSKNSVIQQFVNELHRMINLQGVTGKVYCGFSPAHTADSHIVTLPVPNKGGIGAVSALYEIGDTVIAKELAAQAAKMSYSVHAEGYDPENAKQYIITSRYERLFKLLKPHYSYIVGDLGEYTKDTLSTITHCLCFDSAASVATGMCEAGKQALAITGDGSFFHSGKNSITEAQQRGVSCKILLLDNGGSQGSGGQKIPGVMPHDIEVTEIDFDDISDKALKQAVDAFVASPVAAILKVNHKV